MLIIAILLFATATNSTEAVEYRPGGSAARNAWDKFYAGDHEPDLPIPLIAAGKRMTLPVCEAVTHRNMKLRRYALSALGYLGDRRALPTLRAILGSKEEIYYFRGDALHSIYQIDRSAGKALATQYRKEHEYLEMIAKAIDQNAKWLTAPMSEDE